MLRLVSEPFACAQGKWCAAPVFVAASRLGSRHLRLYILP